MIWVYMCGLERSAILSWSTPLVTAGNVVILNSALSKWKRALREAILFLWQEHVFGRNSRRSEQNSVIQSFPSVRLAWTKDGHPVCQRVIKCGSVEFHLLIQNHSAEMYTERLFTGIKSKSARSCLMPRTVSKLASSGEHDIWTANRQSGVVFTWGECTCKPNDVVRHSFTLVCVHRQPVRIVTISCCEI